MFVSNTVETPANMNIELVCSEIFIYLYAVQKIYAIKKIQFNFIKEKKVQWLCMQHSDAP